MAWQLSKTYFLMWSFSFRYSSVRLFNPVEFLYVLQHTVYKMGTTVCVQKQQVQSSSVFHSKENQGATDE